MRSIAILLSTFLLLISCRPGKESRKGPCPQTVDLLEHSLGDKDIIFDYDTKIRIDLNRDRKADFEFVPAQSGNRMARMVQGLRPETMVAEPVYMESGFRLDSTTQFVEGINLNWLDSNLDNDYGTLTNMYIGLRMKVKGEYHYGWIRYSTTDIGIGSPLYYSNMQLTLHGTAYNRGCAALVTP